MADDERWSEKTEIVGALSVRPKVSHLIRLER